MTITLVIPTNVMSNKIYSCYFHIVRSNFSRYRSSTLFILNYWLFYITSTINTFRKSYTFFTVRPEDYIIHRTDVVYHLIQYSFVLWRIYSKITSFSQLNEVVNFHLNLFFSVIYINFSLRTSVPSFGLPFFYEVHQSCPIPTG